MGRADIMLYILQYGILEVFLSTYVGRHWLVCWVLAGCIAECLRHSTPASSLHPAPAVPCICVAGTETYTILNNHSPLGHLENITSCKFRGMSHGSSFYIYIYIYMCVYMVVCVSSPLNISNNPLVSQCNLFPPYKVHNDTISFPCNTAWLDNHPTMF